MEVGEWTMQQKRSTMYFVAIPYKMTGQLVLFICQSHFIYCIWQLVSINFGPWDSGALTILGHRKCWDTHWNQETICLTVNKSSLSLRQKLYIFTSFCEHALFWYSSFNTSFLHFSFYSLSWLYTPTMCIQWGFKLNMIL